MTFLQIHYRSRLFVMYLVNSPSTIFLVYGMIKTFMEENTLKKIKIVKKSELSQSLLSHTNENHVEKKYGGLFENLTKFW